jgi:predicted nucleic acid-binding protein
VKLVVDANVLVAEIRRERSRLILNHPLPVFMITELAVSEARHELLKRLTALRERGWLAADQVQGIQERLDRLLTNRFAIVPRERYAALEAVARDRVPGDPDDWPTVALALSEGAAIWTEDQDFFGCGVATWRTAILLGHLGAAGAEG